MELFKNTTIVTTIWVILGILLIIFGVYREFLYRQKDDDQKNKIIELNELLRDWVSGGDSFSYIDFSFFQKEKSVTLMLTHQGKDPLYDLKFRIADIKNSENKLLKFQKNPSFHGLCEFMGGDFVKEIGTLNPKQSLHLACPSWPYDIAGEISYNIFYSARNGSFVQLYRQRFVDKTLVHATKVYREKDGQNVILYENIEPNFPKDQNGNVSWEE